jgi:hypothetical protein
LDYNEEQIFVVEKRNIKLKIYTLEFLTDTYQSLLPEDDNIWGTGLLDMDCRPKKENWKSPKVRIENPVLEKSDFLRLCVGGMVISSEKVNLLMPQLEMVGELLPIKWVEGNGYLCNILKCSNCLNHEKTEWIYGEETKKPIRITKHVFIPSLVPESTIFKIPERKATIYITEGIKDPEDEFKFIVESNRLSGLSFKKVWES